MQTVTLSPRPFQGLADLNRILQVVGEWNATTDFCGYAHPGDIRHFVTNTTRSRDAARHLFVHEGDDGEILAVIELYPPRFRGFNLLVHPAHRGTDLEAGLIAWAEAQIIALMTAEGIDLTSVGSDVMDCDPVRAELLLNQGYQPDAQPFFSGTTRSLLDPIPDSVLPDGFTIRNVAGEHEAEALGVVHSSAFNSNWKPGEYLTVMQAPGFQIDHELIVVSSYGDYAAFLIYWVDPVSRSGLFEPVGCHQDFQRRGLTKALMYEGMRRMKAEGAVTAIVNHEYENASAIALYASVGFTRKYTITDYRKTLKPETTADETKD
ncbi:MAG TPA: GNAT family N-acetyltransferase [Phototrophicaceae bacterium]|jgi:GNAT superfamily N-acetyltransferase|nr:GNAT family N-acetyltransferase [Phototrophicaceae bacterium]